MIHFLIALLVILAGVFGSTLLMEKAPMLSNVSTYRSRRPSTSAAFASAPHVTQGRHAPRPLQTRPTSQVNTHRHLSDKNFQDGVWSSWE